MRNDWSSERNPPDRACLCLSWDHGIFHKCDPFLGFHTHTRRSFQGSCPNQFPFHCINQTRSALCRKGKPRNFTSARMCNAKANQKVCDPWNSSQPTFQLLSASISLYSIKVRRLQQTRTSKPLVVGRRGIDYWSRTMCSPFDGEKKNQFSLFSRIFLHFSVFPVALCVYAMHWCWFAFRV